MGFDVMQAYKDRQQAVPGGTPRESFFGQCGLTSTDTYREAAAKARAPFETRKGQAVRVDILAPGYQAAMDEARKSVTPPYWNGSSVQNKLWSCSQAERERILSDDGYKGTGQRDEYLDQVDALRKTGDSGRYVRLGHQGETSGYLMELEPVGDVHRFLDLEMKDGKSRVLQLPQGSYTVDSSYGPSPLMDDAIYAAKTNYKSYDDIPAYTPAEYRNEVGRLLAEAKGGKEAAQPWAEAWGADGTLLSGSLEDMREKGSIEAYHVPGTRTMFLNMQAGCGLSVPGAEPGASKCRRDASVPVAVLFNENSSSGEVVPLMDMDVTFLDGDKKNWAEVQAGENFVAGIEDLSDRPLPQFEADMLRKFGKDPQPDGRTLEDTMKQDGPPKASGAYQQMMAKLAQMDGGGGHGGNSGSAPPSYGG